MFLPTMEIECGGFTFISNFDSGNLARVELVPKKQNANPPPPGKNTPIEDIPDFEFNIWTMPDCAGTEFENSNRTWFYFGIKGGAPFTLVKLNIVNLNRQSKMYSHGMAPVFRIVPGRNHWDRIKEKPSFTVCTYWREQEQRLLPCRVEDDVFILSFKYRTLENIRAITYFAFTYPYSYVDLQNMLHSVDMRFKNQFGDFQRPVTPDDIYYHRECVCYSLEGRMIDLITISSYHNITSEREPRLKNLFPMSDVPRPFRFLSKKVVFVSARVHPGETPSSFVLNGLLNLLLSRDDPVAVMLRKLYVFKLIPMLNPDGVSQGHYRTDTRGVNLNRMYLNPSLDLHPTVYAARSLIRYYHYGREIPEEFVTSNVDSENNILPNKDDSEKQSCPEPFRAPSLESLNSDPQDVALNNSETMKHPNINRLSNIENKVSDLSLKEIHSDSSQNLNSYASAVSTLEDLTQNNTPTLSDNVLQEKKDVFTSIHESILSSMGSGHSGNNCSVSVVAEGMPDMPLIFNSIPSVVDVSMAPLYASEPVKSISIVTENLDNDSSLSDNNNFVDINVTSCRKIPSADHSIASSSGEESADLGSQQDIAYKEPEEIPDILTKTESISDINSLEGATCLPLNKNDSTNEESGLFLYVDLHGHASKKGIFMYGNYFENVEDSIECMLLPKIMSMNSQNFHFTACNFTERNMYLRDRRDGMSREGSGRVAVLKITGLVRSYTLECNYNTGRIVNTLPPSLKDNKPNPASSLMIPPKYNPQVFEEVGKALGISILDLTGSNPCSRIPHSEFHTLSGIRDWIRVNCIPEQNYVHRVVPSHRQARRQPCTVQVGGMAGMTVPPRPVRPSSSKTRLMTNKRDTNFARTRRLAPLTKSSNTKIGSVKVSSTSHSILCNSDLKSVKSGIENGEDSERKENLSSFHVSSCSQSSSCVKVTKVFPEPKENIGPCSSQRYPGTPKKLKSGQNSGSGVLKQVLAVRTKCAAVGALASGSKMNKGNVTSGRIQTIGNVTVLKKGVAASPPTNMRVPKFRRPSLTKSSQGMSQDECRSLETPNRGACESKVGNDVLRKAPGTGNVNVLKSIDKVRCVKDDQKNLSEQTVVKQGPKRLKISPFKVENSAGVSPLSDVSCKQERVLIAKVKLKEIGVDKFCKEKKFYNRYDSSLKPLDIVSKTESFSLIREYDDVWDDGKEEQEISYQSCTKARIKSKRKPSLQNNVPKPIIPVTRASISDSQGSSNGSKVKYSTKSDKQGKNRISHLSPIKTLQKKKSVDSGRKRGKITLRSLATSVTRFHTPSSNANQSVQPEKKRKKLKSKFP